MLGINERSIKWWTRHSVESLHTCVLSALRIAGFCISRCQKSSWSKQGNRATPCWENRVWGSLWGRGTPSWSIVLCRACGLWLLSQTCEEPFQQTSATKGRSLIALLWLCSCQHSGEAKMMMMMMLLHLRTTQSHLPQLSSLRRKPLSVSISALVCWYPSTGRSFYSWLYPSANLFLCHFPQDCFLSPKKIILEAGTPVHFQTWSTHSKSSGPWGICLVKALSFGSVCPLNYSSKHAQQNPCQQCVFLLLEKAVIWASASAAVLCSFWVWPC